MDIKRIRLLVANTNHTRASKESGVPLRTLVRFNSVGIASYPTLQKLETWAKGRKLPADHKVPADLAT